MDMGAPMIKQENSYYEMPETVNNLGFNGLFSKKSNRISKTAEKLPKANAGPEKNKKAKKAGPDKSIRGFGTKNMLNDEEKLNNRRADDKHYRSWVIPYTDKLLDKSQARFGEYYRYRKEQQIFKDPPPREMEVITTDKMNEKQSMEVFVGGLPGGIARELAVLKLRAKEVAERMKMKDLGGLAGGKKGDLLLEKNREKMKEEKERAGDDEHQRLEDELSRMLPARTVKALGIERPKLKAGPMPKVEDYYGKAPDPDRFLKETEEKLDLKLGGLDDEMMEETIRAQRKAAFDRKKKLAARKAKDGAKKKRKEEKLAEEVRLRAKEMKDLEDKGEKSAEFIMVASSNFMRKQTPEAPAERIERGKGASRELRRETSRSANRSRSPSRSQSPGKKKRNVREDRLIKHAAGVLDQAI